ncbi:lipoprotein [Kitasatospora saccharophila]|uniref:Lipoprotein n=1 Tax=Kitasatospora saccharophila TaxID=407973 RepID=A0ABP5I839_9ACTN
MLKTGRTFLAATAVVLALTATGCGSKGADGNGPTVASSKGGDSGTKNSGTQNDSALDPAALLKLVGEKTSAAKSAKVEITNDSANMQVTMEGAISWQNGLQGELSGKAGGEAAKSLAEAGSDGNMTIRYLTEAMYVNMGDGMAAQLGGAHWIKYGYEDLAKVMGAAGDSLKSQLQKADPVSSVRALIASGKVTKSGTDTVDGAPATKYAGDFNLTDLTGANAKDITQDQIDALQKQLDAAGITTEHIEVWINADNLLVKKVEKFDSKAGPVTTTAVYSDYGTSVTAIAPKAGDTVDFADLMKSAQAGS